MYTLLVSVIECFEFLLGIVIIYEILFAISMLIKKIQSRSIYIDVITNQLQNIIRFRKTKVSDDFVSRINNTKTV